MTGPQDRFFLCEGVIPGMFRTRMIMWLQQDQKDHKRKGRHNYENKLV